MGESVKIPYFECKLQLPVLHPRILSKDRKSVAENERDPFLFDHAFGNSVP